MSTPPGRDNVWPMDGAHTRELASVLAATRELIAHAWAVLRERVPAGATRAPITDAIDDAERALQAAEADPEDPGALYHARLAHQHASTALGLALAFGNRG